MVETFAESNPENSKPGAKPLGLLASQCLIILTEIGEVNTVAIDLIKALPILQVYG